MVQSGWSGRTKLEKILIFGVVFSVLLAIGLLVGVIVLATQECLYDDGHKNDTTLSNVCLTEGCIATSHMLLRNMKPEADPCDDFYEYACGRFLDERIIPDDKTGLTAFSEIEDEMRDHLRLLINRPIEANEAKPFKDLKLLNQACLNLNAIETVGKTQMEAKFADMGRWPVLTTSWDGSNWRWEDTIAKFRAHGYAVNQIFSFSVSTDYRNSSVRSARIDQTGLGLSYEYIIKKEDDKFYLAYKAYQVDLAKLFGATGADLEAKMAQALDFEWSLANISLTREERRDANKLYNPMTIAQLQSNYSQIDWLSYLNSLMPADTPFSTNDIIINAVPAFFEKLFPLLERTPKETIANYLMWRVAFSSASSLSKVFRDRHQEYNRITTGKEVADPRGLQCSDITLSYYPHAVGSLYVRRYFDEKAKAQVLEMIKQIKAAFKGIVDEIDWMDDATKQAAHKKADNMGEQMAYADELLNDTALTSYYSKLHENVEIDLEHFHATILKLGAASTAFNLKKLRQMVDRDDWTSHVTPAIVNAYYSPQENIIKFPAGILQGAFFNPDRPEYMNYGGIGFVIGHEITHGFDDQGSRYDDIGNLANWWNEETRGKFDERAQCIIKQYAGYTEPLTNLTLNGVNTQGENIADNGGIKESYIGYQNWVKEHGEEKLLPGLDLKPNQLFWVSAAQVWCNVQREQAMRNRVLTGVHSPGQFRVIGPMKNRPEFAKDFNCAPGRIMNPNDKCSVW
ncbi:neprilysin-2-like [Chironomus tepperi]|uniref:neprilysin-2-like n=1 Tax=Chironomus tepperi TaxID=113505 RepID=UPI00391F7067